MAKGKRGDKERKEKKRKEKKIKNEERAKKKVIIFSHSQERDLSLDRKIVK